MKYLKLNIQLLLAFVIVLGLFSCTDEDAVDNGKKEIKEGLPTTVSLKLTSATPMVVETKTADDGSKFGVINDLAILVYKTETEELDKVTCVSNVNAKEWDGTFNATTGERRVYVLANSGLGENEIKNAYNQESNLLNAELISAGTVPEGNEQMLGFVRSNSGDFKEVLSIDDKSESITIPESNGETSVITLYSHLYPPYSKITFTVKNEVKTDMSEKVQLNITNVYVRNLPRKYSLLPVKNILKTSGTEDNDDVFSGKVEQVNQGEDVYEFYMYENLQGTINEGNSDPKLKSPFPGEFPSQNVKPSDNYESWNTKWATLTPCTYIEVEGTYAIWKSDTQYGAGKIHYRFFLGANTVDNFDIERNTHYKVELRFTGIAGYNELDYEWRVNAQLEDVTIIPEGTLEIDGASDGYFPFVVINGSSTAKNLRPGINENSSEYMLMYKTSDGWKTSSSLNSAITRQSYTEYRIRCNNLGILGAYTYTGNDSYLLDGNTYTGSYEDNVNNDYRDKVIQGRIYRLRDFKLTNVDGSLLQDFVVKEYPLLCLYDSYDINQKGTVYAQRINRTNDNGSNLISLDEARGEYISAAYRYEGGICGGTSNANGGGSLMAFLPTKDELKRMIDLEKGPFQFEYNIPYWTNEGAYSWNGSSLEKESVSRAYVRCVYEVSSGAEPDRQWKGNKQ